MADLIREIRYDWFGSYALPASGSADGNAFVTDNTGSGAAVAVDSGALKLSFDNTSEAARAAIHFDDHLAFDIDDLVRVEFLVKSDMTSGSHTNSEIAFGVCSAYNATLDSIAEQAMFKIDGDLDILCESDDGTNNTDDIDSGIDIQSDWQRLAIDFARGTQTQSFPAKSIGGLGDLHYYVDNADGYLRRVADGTLFDVSNYSSGLQLFCHAAKSSSTDDLDVWVREICVQFKVRS